MLKENIQGGYTSVNVGLTREEVERRLKKYGYNQIQNKKRISALKIFLCQFKDLIIWVLIGATIISGIMGDTADAITIMIIVFMNAILGFIQEFKTERSLEALKDLTAPTCKVIRSGKLMVINAELLVPGDIVILETGDRIPADAFIIEESNLLVDESLLTGESLGVQKSANGKNNNLFMGTSILTGKAKVRITLTGMDTEMGKIADMLDNIEAEKSPLKEKLDNIGKVLIVLCLGICVIVTGLGVMRGQELGDMFLLGVSLAVAAIPEGLTAIVTIALALGVSRMLKRNALVRKLPAVETLGCTSIICSDKTGTLTQNDMTVKAIYYNGKLYNEEFEKIPGGDILKKAFVHCNDCNFDFDERSFKKSLLGDPTETALIKAYFKENKHLRDFVRSEKRIYDIPFDSDRKMMSVISRGEYGDICYVKGAPERIINSCKYILLNGEKVPFQGVIKERVVRAVEDMSFQALRCIAAAYKEKELDKRGSLEENLIFLGIAGIIDPPRKEAKEAIFRCHTAGIKVVMITGDHKNTAFAIGKELDICKDMKETITGEELDKLSDEELLNKIETIKIFARVSPKHKLRIVKCFKGLNYVVSMTGDGVNDAPAVKEADIGISMGISGTDVTKEASSMILLDDNFATIVSAVEEGRTIYDNIRKFIRYLLSCNLGEVITMFLATVLYLKTPLLPIQILFINLATDGLPAIALGVDPGSDDIMFNKPRKKNESIFDHGLKEKILLRGALIGICTVLSFLIGGYYGMSLESCRTIALGTLVMSQLLHVFECRSETKSLFEINPFTNITLLCAVAISIMMLVSVIYIPFLSEIFHTVSLDFGQWMIVMFFSGIIAFINSIYVFIGRKR
ncbi:MAG: calcium-translocating P-type ATPase, PMCA-type [Clostridium sp.]